ncbi:hypothetical protein [Brevibacillus sp. NRS-1366]
MKVKEFIEKLKEVNPDYEVWFDYGGTMMKYDGESYMDDKRKTVDLC